MKKTINAQGDNLCPNCGEQLKPGAIMCCFCQTGISTEHFRACPFCAEMIRKSASFCRYCKANVSQRKSSAEKSRAAPENQPADKTPNSPVFQPPVAEPDDEVDTARFEANYRLIRQREKMIVADLARTYKSGTVDEETQEQIRALIREKVQEDAAPLTMMEKGILLQNVLDEIFGFGPLGPIMRDPSVRDIYVNAPDEIYVTRRDELIKTAVEFEDSAHLKQTIDKIVLPLGYQFDESHPIVDLRLPNLGRVNVTMGAAGPVLSIRFFGIPRINLPELINCGSLSEPMSQFLQACVRARLNILIGGQTRSGKSSLLGALINSTERGERIITIENEAELDLNRSDNVIKFLAWPGSPGSEKCAVSLADLVNSAKQMLPGRIVMGELSSDGAAELLDFMQTDLNGVITTIKSSSARHSLDRLETMLLQGQSKLSPYVAKRVIVESVQLVITMKKYPDGHRRISEIAELKGLEGEQFILSPLFYFEPCVDNDGSGKTNFVGCRKVPGFHQKFTDMNVHFNPEWMF